jgi:pimeloyl-ACP methyl ester carboxylesterase
MHGSILIDCDDLLLHVKTWGDPAGRPIVIWHGVTGASLDQAPLARALSASGYYVVAPDAPGAGLSDWARDGQMGYGLGAIAAVARALLSRLHLTRVHWIGASKGGGLGIRLAGETPDAIASLLLNDVGVELPAGIVDGLGRRLSAPPRFESLSTFREHVRRFLTRGGCVFTQDKLDELCLGWARRTDDGGVTYHYDPSIANQFRNNAEDFALWPFWEEVRCPSLIVRGEHSEVLSPQEVAAMLERNAFACATEVGGRGHIDFMDDEIQLGLTLDFLRRVEAQET